MKKTNHVLSIVIVLIFALIGLLYAGGSIKDELDFKIVIETMLIAFVYFKVGSFIIASVRKSLNKIYNI